MTKNHWRQADSEADSEADPSPWAGHEGPLARPWTRTASGAPTGSLTHRLETGGRSSGGSDDRSPGGVGRAGRPSGIPWGNLKGPSRLPSAARVSRLRVGGAQI